MRAERRLAGIVVGIVLLAGCGVSGGDESRVSGAAGASGAAGGEVECSVLEPWFVTPRVVGSMVEPPTRVDPTVAEVEAAVGELPADHEAAGEMLVELARGLESIGSPPDPGTSDRIEELNRRYEERRAEIRAAIFWVGEQCRGDLVLWRCVEGPGARFRSIGRAIGDGTEEPPVHATVEDAIEIDGLVEIIRNDREAVYAELDADGYAVRVRSTDLQGDLGWIDQGDQTCDDDDLGPKIGIESEGDGFEPVGEPIGGALSSVPTASPSTTSP